MQKVKRAHSGFTIIEMLVSLTIMSIVVAAVYAAFRQSNESWAMGRRFAEQSSVVRAALDLMERDLGALLPTYDFAGEDAIVMTTGDLPGDGEDNDGDGPTDEEPLDGRNNDPTRDILVDEDTHFAVDTLAFNTVARSPGATVKGAVRGDLMRVEYGLWKLDAFGDPDSPLQPGDDPLPNEPYALVRRVSLDAGGSVEVLEPQILAGNVLSMYAEYMHDGTWERIDGSWAPGDKPPTALRICIGIVDPEQYKQARAMGEAPDVRTVIGIVHVGAGG